MGLALATQTAPAQWWNEDDATIATALALLDEAHQKRKR